MQPVLQLIDVTKRFGSLVANDSVSLTLHRGQIHSLLGENGAGKSTLMNVLYGLYRPNSGKIVLDGREISVRSPKQMLQEGIAMGHQHFMLVPHHDRGGKRGAGQPPAAATAPGAGGKTNQPAGRQAWL